MNKAGIVHRKDAETAKGKLIFLCVSAVNYCNIFKCIVPLTPEVTEQDAVQVTAQVERVKQICKFCRIPRSSKEIQSHIKIKDNEYFRKFILRPLLEENVLKSTIPDKPTSPKQKYYSTKEKKKKWTTPQASFQKSGVSATPCGMTA